MLQNVIFCNNNEKRQSKFICIYMCVLIESTTKQNYKSMYVDKRGFSNIQMNKNQAVLTHCGLKQILIKDKRVNFYIIVTKKFCFMSSEGKKPKGLVTCQMNWVGGAVQNKINDIVNYETEIRMETKFNLYQNVNCYIDCVEIFHVKNMVLLHIPRIF